MHAIRHLFFDLDRTIWDYELNSKETLIDLFSLHLQEKTADDVDTFELIFREENTALWDQFTANLIDKETLRQERFYRTIKRIGVDDRSLALAMEDHYLDHTPSKKRLLPGAIETLEALSKRYVLHIITNGFEDVQHFKLKNCGIDHYFQEVITSDGAKARKPNREIFEYSLALAGASKEESVMIGDDPEIDIVGALNAGWPNVILVNTMNLSHQISSIKEVDSLPELLNIL